MQTAPAILSTPTLRTFPIAAEIRSPCAAAALVIFTAVDGVVCDDGTGSTRETFEALRLLAQRDIPLVLTSTRPPAELLALQAELGVRFPFVAGGGASLHIPAGYFPQLTRIGAQVDGWNVVEFKVPAAGHAIRLLVSLYRLCSEQVVIVGLADHARDRVLLLEADVPVIVRNDGVDQRTLLRDVPSAYLTTAAGPAGWSEAILGSVRE